MTDMLVLLVGAMLVNDLVLTHSRGPGASDALQTAIAVVTVTAVTLVVATACAWLLHHYLLQPFELTHLRTISYMGMILVVATASALLLQPQLPLQLPSRFLLLPITNASVPAVLLINDDLASGFGAAMFRSVTVALGFSVLLVLFTALRERMAVADVPAPFRGAAISMITAGLLSLALMGLTGLV